MYRSLQRRLIFLFVAFQTTFTIKDRKQTQVGLRFGLLFEGILRVFDFLNARKSGISQTVFFSSLCILPRHPITMLSLFRNILIIYLRDDFVSVHLWDGKIHIRIVLILLNQFTSTMLKGPSFQEKINNSKKLSER